MNGLLTNTYCIAMERKRKVFPVTAEAYIDIQNEKS